MAIEPVQTGDQVGDHQLEARLMRHDAALYAYVERRLPLSLRRILSPEDILQEVWIVAARNMPPMARSDEIGAWLMNATKNKLLDAIKRAVAEKRGGKNRFQYNVRPPSSSAIEPFAMPEANQRTPSSEDAAREAACAIKSAVRVLPQSYREAVTLRYLDGEPVPVIARRIRKTVPATRGLLYRGMRMMRARLGPAWRFFSDDGAADATEGSPRHVQTTNQAPTSR